MMTKLILNRATGDLKPDVPGLPLHGAQQGRPARAHRGRPQLRQAGEDVGPAAKTVMMNTVSHTFTPRHS